MLRNEVWVSFMLCHVTTYSITFTMLHFVMLCYVMLCYVMLCYIMLCHLILCHVMLCYIVLCHLKSEVVFEYNDINSTTILIQLEELQRII